MKYTKTKYGGLVNPGKGHFNGVIHTDESVLEQPLKRKKPSRWFVNSMSDLFHPNVPEGFVVRVFDVMRRAHWHAFQVLTKRPERASELAPRLPWPHNVLLGTSVEDYRVVDRIDALRDIPAAIRFLSCEPLIGPVGQIDLTGIGWVIVGGESGRGSRIMKPEWANEIRDQCVALSIPFFFKQWGQFNAEGQSVGKKYSGRTLGDREWKQHPAVAGYPDKDALGIAVPRLLTDEQWERVAPVLPGRDGTPGGRAFDNRAFIEGVRWRAHSGRPWRELPAEHGRWNTAFVRAQRWHEGGHWPRIVERLGDPLVERLVAAYGARR